MLYFLRAREKEINLKMIYFKSQSIVIIDNYETLPLTVRVLLKNANRDDSRGTSREVKTLLQKFLSIYNIKNNVCVIF